MGGSQPKKGEFNYQKKKQSENLLVINPNFYRIYTQTHEQTHAHTPSLSYKAITSAKGSILVAL